MVKVTSEGSASVKQRDKCSSLRRWACIILNTPTNHLKAHLHRTRVWFRTSKSIFIRDSSILNSSIRYRRQLAWMTRRYLRRTKRKDESPHKPCLNCLKLYLNNRTPLLFWTSKTTTMEVAEVTKLGFPQKRPSPSNIRATRASWQRSSRICLPRGLTLASVSTSLNHALQLKTTTFLSGDINRKLGEMLSSGTSAGTFRRKTKGQQKSLPVKRFTISRSPVHETRTLTANIKIPRLCEKVAPRRASNSYDLAILTR